MHVDSVRPQTKFVAALVAAGVVSSASIVGVTEHGGLPAISTDVANASVITDFLYGVGDAVNSAASGVAYAFDGAFSLPFDATTAIALAAQNPSLSPSLLSWLVNRYVNPSDNYPYWSYPWAIKDSSLVPLAGLLPFGLGASVVDGLNLFSNAINNALSGLPNPDAAVDATNAFWASDIGRTVVAANLAVTAPVWMLYNTAYYLGYLPADLEATFESALQNPSEIPGLVSNLVYGLLSPDYGLLGDLLNNISAPLRTLPGPIGDLATALVQGVSAVVNDVLSLLPAPISPTPLPSAFRAPAQFTETSADVTSVPDTSLDAARTFTLTGTDTVEKKIDATDSTIPAAQEQGPVVTPEDTTQAPTDPVDPPATPVVTPKVPEVKVENPVTNVLKSGNKVSPGDKFGQAKGETVKNDGTPETTPGTTVDPVSEPTGPTAPQGSDPQGADKPDTSGAPSSEAGAGAAA